MKTTVAFRILNKAVALLVKLTAPVEIFLCAFSEIVVVNEVVARVIGYPPNNPTS